MFDNDGTCQVLAVLLIDIYWYQALHKIMCSLVQVHQSHNIECMISVVSVESTCTTIHRYPVLARDTCTP